MINFFEVNLFPVCILKRGMQGVRLATLLTEKAHKFDSLEN